MKFFFALLAGMMFGVGLILSGMSDPSKVIGFLDITGNWDPSLAFVLGGAVAVGLLVFPFAIKRQQSLLGEVMHLPTSTQIDRRLVIGSITFGVGWGLAGYCPGPALASLAYGGFKPLIFFIAMLVGMGFFEMLENRKAKTVQVSV